MLYLVVSIENSLLVTIYVYGYDVNRFDFQRYDSIYQNVI